MSESTINKPTSDWDRVKADASNFIAPQGDTWWDRAISSGSSLLGLGGYVANTALKAAIPGYGLYQDITGNNPFEMNLSEKFRVPVAYAAENTGTNYEMGPQPNPKTAPSGGSPSGGSPSPQSSQPQQVSFDSVYNALYPGWDRNAAEQDWIAKGRPAPGGSGGNGMSDALAGIKNVYGNAYNEVFSALDRFAGLIPQYKQEREQGVNSLYGTQLNEINTNMQGSLGALEGSKQSVAMKQAQAVRDLQENLRNMLQAGNIQLGVGGAGDSSASKMLGYALSKQAARGSADISNQSMAQYGQIDAQAQQIRATADDQISKLGTWKADNLNQVITWAQGMLGDIEAQKVNATGQKAQALAASEAGIIQSALSRLQGIDDQVSQWKQGIQSWALNRLASLDDAKLKLGQLSKYSASDIVANELKGMNGNTSGMASSANMAGYNPFATQKREAEDFLSNYR